MKICVDSAKKIFLFFILPQKQYFLVMLTDSQVKPFQGTGYRLGSEESGSYDNNDELQRALQLSLTDEDNQKDENYDDLEMKRAIELSLKATSNQSLGGPLLFARPNLKFDFIL